MIVAASATAAAVAAIAVTIGTAGGEAPSAPVDHVGNTGTTLSTLLPRDHDILSRMGRPDATVKILSERSGQGFYRIESSKAECFAVGAVPVRDAHLGQIMCAGEFPSSARPILDFTVLKADKMTAGGKMIGVRIVRSAGIAADGVATVAFRNEAGDLIGETPVERNIYSFASIPPGEIASLVARDANGKIIATIPFGPGTGSAG